jgi:hypothetical protein
MYLLLRQVLQMLIQLARDDGAKGSVALSVRRARRIPAAARSDGSSESREGGGKSSGRRLSSVMS